MSRTPRNSPAQSGTSEVISPAATVAEMRCAFFLVRAALGHSVAGDKAAKPAENGREIERVNRIRL